MCFDILPGYHAIHAFLLIAFVAHQVMKSLRDIKHKLRNLTKDTVTSVIKSFDFETSSRLCVPNSILSFSFIL